MLYNTGMENTNETPKYTTIHFVADDDIKEYLERRARETDRNVSSYLRFVIRQEMARLQAAAEKEG